MTSPGSPRTTETRAHPRTSERLAPKATCPPSHRKPAGVLPQVGAAREPGAGGRTERGGRSAAFGGVRFCAGTHARAGGSGCPAHAPVSEPVQQAVRNQRLSTKSGTGSGATATAPVPRPSSAQGDGAFGCGPCGGDFGRRGPGRLAEVGDGGHPGAAAQVVPPGGLRCRGRSLTGPRLHCRVSRRTGRGRIRGRLVRGRVRTTASAGPRTQSSQWFANSCPLVQSCAWSSCRPLCP